jgi:hypothetical protein
MRTCALVLCLIAALAAAIAGCGTTERSGDVGDTLEAEGLEVTVDEVDTQVPVPKSDITGLSQPSPGTELVGVRVRVCSDHPGALGPYDFGVETTSGDDAKLKFPASNYPEAFEALRADCGDGWVVFEIPDGTDPERVTFAFQDTGSADSPQNTEVDARFSWTVAD